MKPGKTNVETSHVEPSGINHFTPKWVSIEVKLGPGVSLTLYRNSRLLYIARLATSNKPSHDEWPLN